ncbi:MAG: hypothetical protein ACI4AE_03260 [Candidatus Cryptobacteroides sp.]
MQKEIEFIREHSDADTSRLLLSRNRWPEVDMDLVVNTMEGRKRMAPKVPQWAGRDDLLYPTRLCTEQCSSADTASCKADVLKRLGARRVADLTGGLGVDSWFFSSVADEVLYNEMNPVLAAAAGHNFSVLGAAGDGARITVESMELRPDTVDSILGGFNPDCIFLDPARRDSAGRKVFRLEDCTPDILLLKDVLLERARFLVAKLSPMADISLIITALGNVSEVHCISSGGECKELIAVMDREAPSGVPPAIIVADRDGEVLRFRREDENSAPLVLADTLPQGGILFEPSKAVAKAGCFKLLCSIHGLVKIGHHTHLYLLPEVEDEEKLSPLRRLGKLFRILEVAPLNNRSAKETGRKWPGADLTARNLPMDTDTLSKKMGLGRKSHTASAARPPHIFGVRADFSSSEQSANYLIITSPL